MFSSNSYHYVTPLYKALHYLILVQNTAQACASVDRRHMYKGIHSRINRHNQGEQYVLLVGGALKEKGMSSESEYNYLSSLHRSTRKIDVKHACLIFTPEVSFKNKT